MSPIPRTTARTLPHATPGEPVRLQGWVHRRRELAAVTFLVVRDRTGLAQVVVKHGPNAGSTFLLEAAVTTAGRNPDSDVFLDDVTVSRKHAEFRREDDGFYVHDQGSLNGTYVNRERVDVTKLASNDEVQIGKFKLVFFAGE